MKKSLVTLTIVLSLALSAASASAGSVTCPGLADIGPGVRVFSVFTDPVATCLAYGSTNDKDWADVINWSLLDKSDDITSGFDGWLTMDPNSGTQAGRFEVAPIAWANYSSLVLLLKVGGGTTGPDWAAFQLAQGTLEGDWTVSGTQAARGNSGQETRAINGSLSHASLYGQGVPQVPEPASMLLFGTGLLGASFAARRHRK